MSQQSLDLRKSVQIVRHRKRLVGGAVALGILIGAGFAVLNAPPLRSTALVVLPQAAAQSAQSAGGGSDTTAGTSGYMATQVVIASSDPVLSAALPRIEPPTSLLKLQRETQVQSVTDSILSITVSGSSAAQAEDAANAVANSYVSYLGSSRAGRVQANVLQPAMTATRTNPLQRQIIFGLLGALAGALIGVIAALAISREDRRLRERDEIASSIGVPVLASFPVAHPSDAAAWTRLLAEYEPTVVNAWRMRRLLQQVGIADITAGNEVAADGCSLTILSLSSDGGALALGPQLAAFAASLGIPTTLVLGLRQDLDATANLRTACGAPLPPSPTRPRQLRIDVESGSAVGHPAAGMFTVVVAVVDSKAPRVAGMMRTTTTLLGASAGAVTAEQLARAAVSAASDGREVTGILVADPETSDRTTGRVPQLSRPARYRPPTRVEGRMVREILR
jgi:capsular polysaccharide biosynthesis protein